MQDFQAYKQNTAEFNRRVTEHSKRQKEAQGGPVGGVGGQTYGRQGLDGYGARHEH